MENRKKATPISKQKQNIYADGIAVGVAKIKKEKSKASLVGVYADGPDIWPSA